jgi:hypothetical protein
MNAASRVIMKTNHRKIRQLNTSFFLFATCIGFMLSSEAPAQPGKARTPATRSKKITPKTEPPKKEYVNWYVSYTVTIKGNGELKGDTQGSPDIKWWVDRSFVGKMRLDGPTPLRNGNSPVPGYESYENYGPSARPWTVNVKIKDRIEKLWEGPGEIGTHEDRTEVTVWEGSPTVSGPPADLDTLAVKKETQTYFVLLTVIPKSTDKNIRMSRFTIFDRSDAGYGGKPTHEVTKPLEDQIAISDIPMPNGDHLSSFRKNSWITSTKPKGGEDTLPPTYPYTIEFPRTCFPPKAPFFEGIADTKTKVEICVEFLLSKIPH